MKHPKLAALTLALSSALIASASAQAGTLQISVPGLRVTGASTGNPPTAEAAKLSHASSVAFASAEQGDATGYSVLHITNSGGTAGVVSASYSGSNAFSIASTSCNGSLAAGRSCDVTLAMATSTAGSFSGNLQLYLNSTAYSTTAVTGSVVAPRVSLTLQSLDFPSTMVGSTVTQNLSLMNESLRTVTLNSVSPQAGTDFTAGFVTCGASLTSGSTCDLSVTFAPKKGGNLADLLTVSTSLGAATATLQGTAQALTATASPQQHDFGLQTINATKTKTLTFTATSKGVSKGYVELSGGAELALSNNTCGTKASTVALAKDASCRVTVSYTPSSLAELAKAAVTFSNTTAGVLASTKLTGSGLESTALNLDYTQGTDNSSGAAQTVTVNSSPAPTFTTNGLRFASATATSDLALTYSPGVSSAADADFTLEALVTRENDNYDASGVIAALGSAGVRLWIDDVGTTGKQYAGFQLGSDYYADTSTSIAMGTTTRLKIVRNAGVVKLYVNGVQTTFSKYNLSSTSDNYEVAKVSSVAYSKAISGNLTLGNSEGRNRPWRGVIHSLTFLPRATN